MSAMNPRQQARDKEENGIHDAKRKTSLEHRARLVDVDAESIKVRRPDGAQVDKVRVPAIDRGAVHGADPPEIINGGDEGADEGEVDEGDELRVGGGAVVAEQRGDGPGEREDGDDEED